MPIETDDQRADAPMRKAAAMAGIKVIDEILTTDIEAIDQRRNAETPLQTAARLRKKHGVVMHDQTSTPLAGEVFDKAWSDG